MKKKTFCIILEYCGGAKTDALFQKLSKWNPDYNIHILDNASVNNRCSYITHQNLSNTGIGGGIKDCLRFARNSRAEYLFFMTNDIIPINEIDIGHLEQIIIHHQDIVQLGVSLTRDSDKQYYPWMINQGENDNRIVRHSDLLCCFLNLDFIESFGGFPDSRSGWGYDWEIGYQARINNKKIVICDAYSIRHVDQNKENAQQIRDTKFMELKEVYNKKYGDYKVIEPSL